jgi:23S rRNA (adenine2503-C2)-methyltransferase
MPAGSPNSPHDSMLGLTLQELTDLVLETGEPAYRAQQLFDAVYRQGIDALEDISTLPRSYRARIAEQGWRVGSPAITRQFESADGTIRYLMELADGETVETVWMPEGDDGEAGDGSEASDEIQSPSAGSPAHRRATICVSSQVGCAVNCRFCLTALLGVKRNLTAGEIVGQVVAVLRDRKVELPRQRVNLVFMGQGEPLLNYENFMKSVRLLVEGVGIPESRMTVSTAGIVPRIYDFGREPVRPKLAISLNAPNDKLRAEIMPLNRKWNVAELMSAAREFPLRARERLTFEYVLLDEVNDAPQHAREMAELVRGVRAKVNLIALNPGAEIPYRTPVQQRVLEFQRILVQQGIPTFIRRPRGRDIFAACGQLKRTVELTALPS